MSSRGLRKLGLLLTLCASALWADTIDYTITGIFPTSIPKTAEADPGAPFTVTFSLPPDPVSTLFPAFNFQFLVTAPAVLSFDQTQVAIQSAPIIFSSSNVGISIYPTGSPGPGANFYRFGSSFVSPLFSGSLANPTLLPGNFPFNPSDSYIYSYTNVQDGFSSYLTSPGLISAVLVPEPLTLALCGFGLLGCLLLRRTKSLVGGRKHVGN